MEGWMSSLLTFVQERWIVILIAAFALFIIVKLLQTVFKWLIAAVIIIVLVTYGIQYSDQFKEVGNYIKDYTVNEWNDIIEKETSSAEYEAFPDGTFKITSKNMTLEGSINDDQVRISLYGSPKMTVPKFIFEGYIERSLRASSGEAETVGETSG